MHFVQHGPDFPSSFPFPTFLYTLLRFPASLDCLSLFFFLSSYLPTHLLSFLSSFLRFLTSLTLFLPSFLPSFTSLDPPNTLSTSSSSTFLHFTSLLAPPYPSIPIPTPPCRLHVPPKPPYALPSFPSVTCFLNTYINLVLTCSFTSCRCIAPRPH